MTEVWSRGRDRKGPRRVWAGLVPVIGATLGAGAQCPPAWRAYSAPALDASVFTVASWDPDGSGPAPSVLVAGGNFHEAGTLGLDHVGAWDGSSWRALGAGVNGTVFAAHAFDPDGPGPVAPLLVVGGSFTESAGSLVRGIARFDGALWQEVGGGLWAPQFTATGTVLSTQSNVLLVGGLFTHAGGVPSHGAAKWDGVSWQPFTNELFGFSAFAGYGGSLYAGGAFSQGSNVYIGIVRWTGESWSTVGQNYPGDDVLALAAYRGELVAGGYFTNACCGNPPAPGEFVARFDGSTWRPLGLGLNGTVRALCTFDPDGPGPLSERLFAGGSFTTAGGAPASGIAAWDGENWAPLGEGTNGSVRSLAVWNGQLVAAGDFYSAGGLVSPGMAFWGCPARPCYPNCDGSVVAPALNVSDFICYINRYAAGDPYANCDGSTGVPLLNVADFICFLNRYGAGCP